MEYKIVCVANKIYQTALNLLADSVRHHLKEKFKPLGGISVVCKDGIFMVSQVVFKESERSQECFPGRD